MGLSLLCFYFEILILVLERMELDVRPRRGDMVEDEEGRGEECCESHVEDLSGM